MKKLNVWRICQIEEPRSEVVDQPCNNSVGETLLLERKEERIHGGWFPYKSRRWESISISFFTSSDKFPCTISYWVSAWHFLIRYQKRIDFCTSTARTFRILCSSWNDCHSTGNVVILHLGILLNRSNNSYFPATPVFVK